MKLIPIDIALIPPQEILDLCIDIHQDSRAENSPFPELGKIAVPHISLAMLVIHAEDLPIIKKLIEDFWSKYEKFNLTISGLNADFYDPLIGNVLQFNLIKSDELAQLQNLVADLARVYAVNKYDPKELDLLSSSDNSKYIEFTVNWIDSFLTKPKESFSPHITLGLAKLSQPLEFNLEFAAKDLGIYHLGCFCTCQKLL